MRTDSNKQIAFWLDNERIAALDRHLDREAAHVPGARMTRAGWVAALVAREITALAAVDAVTHEKVSNREILALRAGFIRALDEGAVEAARRTAALEATAAEAQP